MSGLDPTARVEFQELLSEVAQMGKTIFLSSHILTDVTRICNRVGVMKSGRLVAYGSLQELKTRLDLPRTIQIKLIGQSEKVQAVLKSNPYVSDISNDELQTEGPITTIRIQFRAGDEKIVELLTVLVRLGIQVLSFEVDANEMGDVFSYITKGNVNS